MKNVQYVLVVVAILLGLPLTATAETGLDRRFVGDWRHTNTYVSGDFSAASEKYVQFRNDGTFIHRTGRLVGGGSSGSFDSGRGGNTKYGRWQVQNRILYYLLNGTNQWLAYGRYGFTDDRRTMMITFGDGSKEIWERR